MSNDHYEKQRMRQDILDEASKRRRAEDQSRKRGQGATMKKVYIVTSGEYSNYHIERVFSTRAKAKKFTNKCNDYRIEAHDVDATDGIKVVTEYRAYVRGDGTLGTYSNHDLRPSDYSAQPVRFKDGSPVGAYSLKSEAHAKKLLVEALQAHQRQQAMIESGLTEEQP